jgi:hypothetical protein
MVLTINNGFYMKASTMLISFVLLLCVSLEAQQDATQLTGPYLGQKVPGTTPEVFAPGVVSTDAHEFSSCFSPDGNEFYFTRRHPGLKETVIMFSKQVNGVWTEPEVAPFIGKSFSFEPFVTPDNKRLYFQAGKVSDGALHMLTQYVDRTETGWGEVKDPGDPFSPDKTMHISVTHDGTVYTTDISGGMGTEALGMIKYENGGHKKLEKLGAPFNKEKLSQHPWIAPDESYILYTVRRPGQTPIEVLFFSSKKNDGGWSEPVELKLGMDAGQPFVTPDGKYLFFSSGEMGKGDIYWVSTKVLEGLRQK